MINIVTSSRYKINRLKIKQFAAEFLNKKEVDPSLSLNVVFVGKNKMKAVTLEYKKENETLPVLSFTYNEQVGNEMLLGEVVLCYPLVVLLAAERNKRVDEMINELVKHGIENLLK